MPKSCLEHQKGTRKLLADLLYKDNYCLCIPEPELIKLHLNTVSSSWIQKLLLSKNTLGLSVIPMFMLIFIKNKLLTAEQSYRLQQLLYLLVTQAEINTIDQIFSEKLNNEMDWVYYILKELMKFTHYDFLLSQEKKLRIIAFAECIEFFLEKSSPEKVTELGLDPEKKGFPVIQKVMYLIAYKPLDPLQVSYLTSITKKLIYKTSKLAIDRQILQIQFEGFSFIWCALSTSLQLVFLDEEINQVKIDSYRSLISFFLNKMDSEKLMAILLEKNGIGYFFVLRYIFFIQSKLTQENQEKIKPFNTDFNLWLKSLFSVLTIETIELMLVKLPSLLLTNTSFPIVNRKKIMNQFFDYLFNFTQLKSHEIARLNVLKEQLDNQIFPISKPIKLFRQVRAYFNLFKLQLNFSSVKEIKELDDDLNENSTLIRHSDYAKLVYS